MKAVISWSALIACLILVSLTAKVFLKFQNSPLRWLNRLTIVCLDRQDRPLLISLESRKALLVALPATEKVRVPLGFGEYELNKVYQLGQLEGKGGDVLMQTIRQNFAVALTGYLRDPNLEINEVFSRPENFLKGFFWRALKKQNKTNFSRWDLLILAWRFWRLDLAQLTVRVYPEGAPDDYQDNRLRQEAFSVEILNATDHNGLAQSEADFLEKNGLRVIRVADAPEKQTVSKIIQNNSDLNGSYTLAWFKLNYHFPFESEEGKKRADVTVILGEDYWKMITEKW